MQQPQPSPGIQDLLADYANLRFRLTVALEQMAAKDARIAELEKNQKKPKRGTDL